jgi:hypothetical protein
MRSMTVPAAIGALVGGLVLALPSVPTSASTQSDPESGGGLEVYVVEVPADQLGALDAVGIDTDHVTQQSAGKGRVRLDAVVTEFQAEKLRAQGISLSIKRIDGKKASEVARAQNLAGYDVFRSYSETGGIADELRAAAAAYPRIAKLVTVGHSVNGQSILALKITKQARTERDGARPSVLYLGAQHAREWITPEMVTRLMRLFLAGYGNNSQLTKIVNTTELWFLPVANPDGYDYTFSTDRLWRKNLRDNDGDHAITPVDGVDPNRNHPYKWGWDNEGSSASTSSETFRGAGPASEPETRALVALFRRVDFEFMINYHSAAELLLYGIGWQVSTPSPDDTILEALAGTDTNPAVPGYDPDLSAELYIVNGETDGQSTVQSGTLSFTPEMTTCETASNLVPDDQWVAADCLSGFNFPDDEALIQGEFEKNIPFALAVAKSAQKPNDPVSSVGLKAPDLVADPFTVSHGTRQPVAVTADRAVKLLRLRYRINGGSAKSAPVSEWKGGERYGDTHDDYYGEFRGNVTGTHRGDSVEVWFTGFKGLKLVKSEPFTYQVASDIGGDVLILAAEDVTGLSPTQTGASAHYAGDYATALQHAGYSSDVYDVDVQGRTAPHHLGVLSHYDAVVWESGDDIIPRAQGQVPGTVDDLALQLEVAVRDYVNEGGKVLVTGQFNQFAAGQDGAYWYNPFAPPECTTSQDYPCLPLLNDFQQYWLGAYGYVSDSATGPDGPYPVVGTSGVFDGFAGTFNGGTSADNQFHTASLLPTSSFLPAVQFPQFASSAPMAWDRPGAAPYSPFTGDWYVHSQTADVSWKRLSRTVDLTGASSADLQFKISYDTEPDWDFVTVEAHEVGTDVWTTLPDINGHTASDTGLSCPEGWVTIHPFVEHYQGADCSSTGSSGSWNAASGRSDGWQDWDLDLSAYAGSQVELSISYISDWATQGLGVFVDDTRIVVDGATNTETSFEDGLGGWVVADPPDGSFAPNNWIRTQQVFDEGAAAVTDDTVFTGFGAEGLTSDAMRDSFVARAMEHLLG